MSYTPTVWATGDIINAEKLNKMENGIANAYDVIMLTTSVEGDYTVLSKTFGEIKSDILSGKLVFGLISVSIEEGTAYSWDWVEVGALNSGGGVVSFNGADYIAQTDADYPAYSNK